MSLFVFCFLYSLFYHVCSSLYMSYTTDGYVIHNAYTHRGLHCLFDCELLISYTPAFPIVYLLFFFLFVLLFFHLSCHRLFLLLCVFFFLLTLSLNKFTIMHNLGNSLNKRCPCQLNLACTNCFPKWQMVERHTTRLLSN